MTLGTLPAKPINSRFNDSQWEAIHQRGSNILVSASAGSGKTTVLIERILNHLLTHYANMDQLLVSTFTEAAASEMKARMENRLKQAVNQTADRAEQAHLVSQLQLLPASHIRTLHSFCLQVIQQYFYIIDFDPSFRLLTDETQKSLLYQEVWQELMIDLAQDPDWQEKLFQLLAQFSPGPSDQGLYQLVLDLYQFASSHPEPQVWLSQLAQQALHFEDFAQTGLYQAVLLPEWQASLAHAQHLLEQALASLESLTDAMISKLQPLLEAERSQVQDLQTVLTGQDLAQVFAHFQKIAFDRWPSGKKAEEDKELLEQVKALRDQAKEQIERVRQLMVLDYDTTVYVEGQAGASIQDLAHLTLEFRQALWQAKVAQNCIDYNDLEHLTLDILAPYDADLGQRQPSEAALYYQDLFREVLVDEYQDINDIQATILSFLSRERRQDLSGNLFMVGDVKQSIYGFRMAEPSLFLAKYQAYQEGKGGHLIVLDANYRSRDEILQFTNFVFQRLMDPGFGEMQYGAMESLKTGNHSFLPAPPDPKFDIEFLLYESSAADEGEPEDQELDLEQGVETSLEAEAWLIGRDIQARVQAGWQIYDKELGQQRPVTYQDFVILSSTRHPFQPVKQVFEQLGIPLLSQNVENYFQRQEIRLMLALLKLIDNPHQDIPLVAILRSHFVGLSDEQLSQIRIRVPNSGSFYEACQQVLLIEEASLVALQETLGNFMDKLKEWRQLAQRVDLVTLIWTLYQETYFLDYVAGLDQGDQRQANLHAFYERVVEFEAGNYKGLTAFVGFIEQIMAHDQDLAEPLLLSEDQNFVRVMTVHASKGLEFPFVYLMQTGKRFNIQDTQKVYVPSKRYGLGLDYLDIKHQLQYPSFIKEAIKLERRGQLKSEEMRKLYVALTRCEQKLVIVGSVKSQDQVQTKQEQAVAATGQELVMNRALRQGAGSWLDWLLMATAFSGRHPQSTTDFTNEQVHLTYVTEAELLLLLKASASRPWLQDDQNWLADLKLTVDQHEVTSEVGAFIQSLLESHYDYGLASKTSSYQSVSELKRLYEEPHNEKLSHFTDRRPGQASLEWLVQGDESREEEDESGQKAGIQSIRFTGDTFQAPRFVRERQAYTAAQIGTFTHYVMQQLDFSALEGLDESDYPTAIQEQAQAWLAAGFMEASQWEAVKLASICQFLASDLGQVLIKQAKSLHREQAFSYRLPAAKLFARQLGADQLQELANSQLLVHGVVDNYLNLPDGRLILIDYKTDRYRPWASLTKSAQIDQIVDKYRFQMSLYARALSLAKGKQVTEVYLVLLDFDQVVSVTDLYDFE